jgi:hypothetical protein
MLQVVLRRNIRGDGNRAAFAVLSLDRFDHLFARTRLARRYDDSRAVLRHPLDDGAADAARRAGDDGDLAGEIEKRQSNLPNSCSILAADLSQPRTPKASTSTRLVQRKAWCYASGNTNARERPWRPSIP